MRGGDDGDSATVYVTVKHIAPFSRVFIYNVTLTFGRRNLGVPCRLLCQVLDGF